ncbi:MAG: helix-turn-helix transcriptional regulator [Candidatus Aminicenantes bacterium]|nr:helix-turn-helix transcriptional regulator [Candidatus Aminicenantes bacterium]
MTEEKGIAYRLKFIREALGLKQKDFAEKLKISGPTLSEIENGKYNPGYDTFYNISKVFNVNLYYLLFGEGEMFTDPIKESISRVESFAIHDEEVKNFLWYFEKSKIFQFRILSFFKEYLVLNQETLEKEIKREEPK